MSTSVEQHEDQQINELFSPMGLAEIVRNQRQINGALCRAIWRLIDALENANLTQASNLDLSSLKDNVVEIARVFPPGCNPRDPRL